MWALGIATAAAAAAFGLVWNRKNRLQSHIGTRLGGHGGRLVRIEIGFECVEAEVKYIDTGLDSLTVASADPGAGGTFLVQHPDPGISSRAVAHFRPPDPSIA